MPIDSNKDLRSIAKLTTELQQPFRKIQGVVEANGIRPALRLNDVDYFSGDAVESICHALQAAPAE